MNYGTGMKSGKRNTIPQNNKAKVQDGRALKETHKKPGRLFRVFYYLPNE